MSNFFAALDDSDDEKAASIPAKKEVKKETKKEPPQKAPAKSEERRKPAGAGGHGHAGRHNANRNTKYGRGGPPPNREGKRQYDRRSGTGRGKEIKKDGGGAHNWGSDAIEARSNEGTVDEENVDAAPETIEEVTEVEETVEQPEPEDNTMSYEEYLEKKKEQTQSENLKPKSLREVENEFANASAKVSVEEDFVGGGGGKEKKVKKQAAAKEAPEVELGFRAAGEGGSNFRGSGRGRGRGRRDDSEGGRGGRGRRGGRGDGRGRGGRDGRGRGNGRGPGGRSGRGRGELNVNNEQDFPTLGATKTTE